MNTTPNPAATYQHRMNTEPEFAATEAQLDELYAFWGIPRPPHWELWKYVPEEVVKARILSCAKPIRHVPSGEEFDSIMRAARRFGLRDTKIRTAIARGSTEWEYLPVPNVKRRKVARKGKD